MWVVALMIGTAAGYLLLALSLAAANALAFWRGFNVYYDPVTGGLRWLLKILEFGPVTLKAVGPWLQASSNLVYSFAALLVIALAHRILRRDTGHPPALQEPGMISVGLIVAVVMSAAYWAATWD